MKDSSGSSHPSLNKDAADQSSSFLPSLWHKLLRPFLKRKNNAEASLTKKHSRDDNDNSDDAKLLRSFTKLIKQQLKPFHDSLKKIQALEQQVIQLNARLEQVQYEQQWQRAPVELLMDGMSQYLKPPVFDAPAKLLISVITPVWNREQTLPRALRSLQSQTFTQWECLIVDDGSEDESVKIAEVYAASDSRFHPMCLPHRGAATARNTGIQHAKGDIIVYLDSDNEYTPDYLWHVAAVYMADPQVMCGHAAIRYMDGSNGPIICYGNVERSRLLKTNTVDLNSFSHRRAVWEKLGGFDEQLKRLQDWDLILRYTEHLATVAIPVIAARYFTGEENRITKIESQGYARHHIESKHLPDTFKQDSKVRVLIITPPDLPASAHLLRHEIPSIAAAGFTIKTWSHMGHSTSLLKTLTEYQPHTIHIASLQLTHQLLPTLSGHDATMAVTCSSLEGEHIKHELCSKLEDHAQIKHLYLHQSRGMAKRLHSDKIRILRKGVHLNGHHPNVEKDHRLILALVSGDQDRSSSPAIPAELLTAISHGKGEAKVTIEADKGLHEDHATMLRAGLFLLLPDEHGADRTDDCTWGALNAGRVIEAMTCGCVPLLPATTSWKNLFLNKGPLYYDGLQDAARLIDESTAWSASTWKTHTTRCLDLVYPEMLASHTLKPMLNDWRLLARSPLQGLAKT